MLTTGFGASSSLHITQGTSIPISTAILQPNSHSFDQQLLATYFVPYIHSQSKTTNTWRIMNASLKFKLDLE